MKVTPILVIINILVFFFTLTDLGYYVNTYGFNPGKFLWGEYWRIFTAIFLHASLGHLFLNMITLFFIGLSIEDELGGLRYLLVYLFSGILGNFGMCVSLFCSPDMIGVGASGAIAGLIGLGAFLSPGRLVISQFIIPLPFILVGVLYFITNGMNLFTPSNIGYPVHFLGLLVGSFFGLIWSKNWKKRIFIFILVLFLVSLLPYLMRMIF